MRVTLVTETYAPQVNGVSRTLGQLVRVLTEAGDAVQVIHPDYGAPKAGADDHLVRAVNPPFYPELFLPIPPFGPMRRAIDAFRPDLIHIATEATLGLSALRHAHRRSIPTVSSFHTNFDQYTTHYGFGWAKGLIWRYLRWFHNRTLQTYVPSPTTADALRARGFERLVLWPRGVDGGLFRPDRPGRTTVRAALGFAPDDVVIGHVSRIATEKNVGYLADALELVEAARPRVKLLIVGDGPARPDLETRLGAQARFVGYRSGDDLADHYAAADLFAFASQTETFGNVVLEAMASALPVVAVRAGGPGDTVRDGQTGLLIDPDSPPDQFAAALLRLIDDPALRRSMAASARSYALTQTWDAIMMDLRSRYQDIIGTASSRGGRGRIFLSSV
jgi:glycosyltransferase involved in cell wall biosynthesis